VIGVDFRYIIKIVSLGTEECTYILDLSFSSRSEIIVPFHGSRCTSSTNWSELERGEPQIILSKVLNLIKE
jgi:hypothetical protein